MLKPKEMAARLGVSVRTLQRWDNDKKLIAYRTPTNRRYYTEAQVAEYFKKAGERVAMEQERKCD